MCEGARTLDGQGRTLRARRAEKRGEHRSCEHSARTSRRARREDPWCKELLLSPRFMPSGRCNPAAPSVPSRIPENRDEGEDLRQRTEVSAVHLGLTAKEAYDVLRDFEKHVKLADVVRSVR